MSDQELEQILKEIKMRANAQTPIEPPKSSANNDVSHSKAPYNTEKEIDEIINIKPIKPKTAVESMVESFSNEDGGNDTFSFVNTSDTSAFANDDDNNELTSDDKKPKKKSKKPLIIAIAIILIVALAAGIYFGFFYKKDTDEQSSNTNDIVTESIVDEESGVLNPLTGESGYNEAAVGKRPVAVVVENEYSTESVRPQWGLSDADIVLEGESEYSTRLLLFWADYTAVPEQVGPTRSARPPFIRFSQLFDSVFIHAGLSKSKGSYVGADTVFESEDVDHINLLSSSEDGTYFGRNYDRTSTVEHTGYLNGTNLSQLIESKGFRTDLDESSFTAFEFNTEAKALSSTSATSVEFKWSDVYSTGKCPKTGTYTYDSEGGYYTTTDFDSSYGTADLQFENLIFLLDETEYVVKENYKGSGSSETYCNYNLTGGEGKVLSQGTVIDITWGVSDGKLWMKDSDGQNVVLNAGKSYIGYGSSNHGGSITINPDSSAQ
jgi:hypothetical protein